MSVCAATEPTCHFCKRNSLPQYQATLPEGNVLNFCSSQCVTKFQVGDCHAFINKNKKKNIQVYKNELLFEIDLKYSSFFWSYVLWFMFLFLFLRTLLFKQQQTDSHLSPPLTTPFSWNATTAEEPSVWNLRLWNGRWDHLFCWRKLLKFITNLTN